MSMQSLNQLVARSIIDPAVAQVFGEGNISSVLEEMNFSVDMRAELTGITALNWTDFAVQAYRIVKAAEEGTRTQVQLPSPLEGLSRDTNWTDNEHVA